MFGGSVLCKVLFMPPEFSGIIFDGGFCLISAFITCGLGFFVYAQKPSSTLHRLFLAVMISAAYWATGEFFIWQADSPGGVYFWLKFSSFWPMTIAFGSHFILEFTETYSRERKGLFILAAIYLAAFVLSITGMFTDWLYVVIFQPGTGYLYIPADTVICRVEIIYTAFIMLWSLGVGFFSWRYTEQGTKHTRNGLLFAGIIITVFFGMLSGIILPAFHIYIPNLVFIGFVLLSVLTAYAIRRYGLFILSPETAVPGIMKAMPDGMILVDRKGEIVAVNESAGIIIPSLKESPTGKSSRSFVSGEDYEAIKEEISEKGGISDYELSPPGETERFISISGSAVRDREGGLSGAVLIARDITGRKESERSLQAANNKLSLLSKLTRHDIANLVTALSGYLYLLGGSVKDPKDKEYLDKSLEITGLIMKQIEFSRNYQDIGSEEPRWIDPEKEISGAKECLVSGEVGIRLEIDPVLIYADPLLEKVFYNLIENPVRHGEKITEIVISTEEQEDGSLILRIKDDGAGIPEDEKEKIFAYGYGKNTGFGLALARDVLSVTGIKISENGVCGEGASFEIHIPEKAWKRKPKSGSSTGG